MANVLLLTTCQVCHGWGKVHPLKDGKVDYSSLVFCRCQWEKVGKIASPNRHLEIQEIEHYREITPEDFDFPVSFDMRRWINATYGNGDPGPCEPVYQPKPQVFPWDIDGRIAKRLDDRIDKIKGELAPIRDTLLDHIKAKGKKQATKKIESKGIEL